MDRRAVIGISIAFALLGAALMWRAAPTSGPRPTARPAADAAPAPPPARAAATPREAPVATQPREVTRPHTPVRAAPPQGGPPNAGAERRDVRAAAPTEDPGALLQALIRDGEAHLEADDPERALAAYRAAIEEAPDHQLAPFASYKLAWAEYNLDNLPQAIADMEEVAVLLGDADTEHALRLVETAERDLDRFMRELE